MNIRYNKIKYNIDKRKLIVPRNKGVISTSITQNWTDQAILCYKSGYNCKECTIGKGDFSFVCQMKKVVKILMKDLGPPEQEKIDKLLA